MKHVIGAISFRVGGIDCSCGEFIRVAPGDRRPERLAEAWLAHRREVGQPVNQQSVHIQHDHGADAFDFGGVRRHATAIGSSRLSARERGRMGAAAKKAKVP